MEKQDFFKEVREYLNWIPEKEKRKLAHLSLARFAALVEEAENQGLALGLEEGTWVVAPSQDELTAPIFADGEFSIPPQRLFRLLETNLAEILTGNRPSEVALHLSLHRPGWVEPEVVEELLKEAGVSPPRELDQVEKAALAPVLLEDPLLGTLRTSLFLVGLKKDGYLVYDLKTGIGKRGASVEEAFDELLDTEVKKELREPGLYGIAVPTPTGWRSHHHAAVSTVSTHEVIQSIGGVLNIAGWGVFYLAPGSAKLLGPPMILGGQIVMAFGKFMESLEWASCVGAQKRTLLSIGQSAVLLIPAASLSASKLPFVTSRNCLVGRNLITTGIYGFLNGLQGTPPELDKILVLANTSMSLSLEKIVPLPTGDYTSDDAFIQTTLDGKRIYFAPYGVFKSFDEKGRLLQSGYACKVIWPDGSSSLEMVGIYGPGGKEMSEEELRAFNQGLFRKVSLSREIQDNLLTLDLSSLPPNTALGSLTYLRPGRESLEGLQMVLLTDDQGNLLVNSFQVSLVQVDRSSSSVVMGRRFFGSWRVNSPEDFITIVEGSYAFTFPTDVFPGEDFKKKVPPLLAKNAFLYLLAVKDPNRPLHLILWPSELRVGPLGGPGATMNSSEEIFVFISEGVSASKGIFPVVVAHEGVHVGMETDYSPTPSPNPLEEFPAYCLTLGSEGEQDTLIRGLKFLLGTNDFQEAQTYMGSYSTMVKRMEEVHGEKQAHRYLAGLRKALLDILFTKQQGLRTESPFYYQVVEYDPGRGVGMGLLTVGIYLAAYYLGEEIKRGLEPNEEKVEQSFERAGTTLKKVALPIQRSLDLQGPSPLPHEILEPPLYR